MKDKTYTITFKDANGNNLYSKTVIRTNIDEVEIMAYFMLKLDSQNATTYTIEKL